jgi:periplasmic copper chaperone A
MTRLRTLGLATVAALIASLALAASAFAHVTVTAQGATRGGSDQEITFRVPVEKVVDTVGLTVSLPTSAPIASVLVEPVTGWTHTQKSVTLAKPIVTDDGDITTAVTEISWKAQAGHGLVPGEFGAFTIIAGQLPDVSSITFPAIQYYSDGSQVDWTQVAAAGTAEPPNPAPVLQLAASSSAPASGAATVTASATSSGTKSSSSDTGAVVLSIIALVVAAGALGFAFLSRAKARADT